MKKSNIKKIVSTDRGAKRMRINSILITVYEPGSSMMFFKEAFTICCKGRRA